MNSPIISANISHAALMAALHTTIFPHAAWTEATFLSLLSQPGALGLIHSAGGFLFVRTVLDEAEILTFGMVQKRLGYGSVLLQEGLARLKQADIHTLYLEVAAGNEPARLFYEKFGFVLTGRRKAYYEDGDDALTMRLSC